MKFSLVQDINRFLSEGVHSDYAKSLSDNELLKHLKTHAEPNDKNSEHWADRKAAAIKELHRRHKSSTSEKISKAHDKIMAFHSESPSPYVKRIVGSITGQQLVKPKTAPVVKAAAPKAEKSKAAITKKALPTMDSSIHPEGKYDREAGNDKDYPGATKVTNLVHKTQEGKVRNVATIVSNDEGHHTYVKGKKVERNYKHKSHNEALLRAMQDDRDNS